MLLTPNEWTFFDASGDAYPWLTETANLFLEMIVKPDWHVLEFGAGFSTLWFSKKCARVYSIENQQEWYERIKEKNIANVMLYHYNEIRVWFPEGPFDLVLIDSVDRPHWCRRMGGLDYNFNWIKPGGWLVLDNAQRQEYFEVVCELNKKYNTIICPQSNHWHEHEHRWTTQFWRIQKPKGG